MRTYPELLHVTDVGAASGNGVDSTLRILQQYQALGLNARVISAEHSPFAVAFAGLTRLNPQAGKNAGYILEMLGLPSIKKPPVALNCAPRNKDQKWSKGQEDYIYRVQDNGEDASYLIYGPDLMNWVVSLIGKERTKVEKVLAIKNYEGNFIIENTSNGSQFRSAEHLPIVHFLELLGRLDEFSLREDVDSDCIPEMMPENRIVIAPPDEFKNGRVLLSRRLAEQMVKAERVRIKGLLETGIIIAESLTSVEPGRIALWPSSNNFSNPEINVWNLGTRWANGETDTKDTKVIGLTASMSERVGEKLEVEFN